MDNTSKIIEIVNQYKGKQIGLTELQGWFSTLPLFEIISDKEIIELENKLEWINFCVSKGNQYAEVMKVLNVIIEKAK